MIIVKFDDKNHFDEAQNLQEMARVSGFGISFEVKSNDHGQIGNTESPAHIHILDRAGKETAQVVLTLSAPKKPADITWYRTENPPAGTGSSIIKLANSPSKSAKLAGMRGSVWQQMLMLWDTYHGK
jgi:hypothetical protein